MKPLHFLRGFLGVARRLSHLGINLPRDSVRSRVVPTVTPGRSPIPDCRDNNDRFRSAPRSDASGLNDINRRFADGRRRADAPGAWIAFR